MKHLPTRSAGTGRRGGGERARRASRRRRRLLTTSQKPSASTGGTSDLGGGTWISGQSLTSLRGRSRLASAMKPPDLRRGGEEARRARSPPPRRPVPADLVGRCFNCLSYGHVAARCSFPSRCLRCGREGHSAKNCRYGRPRPPPPPRGRGQPARRMGTCRDAVAASLLIHAHHSPATATTASSGSASTGRQYSGPPSICRHSPAPRRPSSPPPRVAPHPPRAVPPPPSPRRTDPAAPPPPARPLRVAPYIDEDGFQLVVSKRQAREERAPPRGRPARRPVPVDLVGRCFNCFSFNHMAARCPHPSRCFRCEGTGHSAKQCKRARPQPPAANGRGRPLRRLARDGVATGARRGHNDKSSSYPWLRKTIFGRLENDDASRSPPDQGNSGGSSPGCLCGHQPARKRHSADDTTSTTPSVGDLWSLPEAPCLLEKQVPDPMRFEATLASPQMRCSTLGCSTMLDLQTILRNALPIPTWDPMLLEAEIQPGALPLSQNLSTPVAGPSLTHAGRNSQPVNDYDVSAADLERVCFDDVSVAALDSPSSSRRNVNIARGPLPSLPFHIEADACTPVRQVIANFAMEICREAPPPVAAAPPPRRRARSPPKTVAIRRSERLARKSRHRATKPVIQAQNVLMRRLGMAPANAAPDTSSYQQFVDTFSGTLSVSQAEALEELLPNSAPMVVANESEPLAL